MLQRAHEQLLDTVKKRMRLTGGRFETGSGWVLFDMGVTGPDTHLRGAHLDPGADLEEMLRALEKMVSPSRPEWWITVHPHALSEVWGPLEEAGFVLDEEPGTPIMSITDSPQWQPRHSVTLVPQNAEGETLVKLAAPVLGACFKSVDEETAQRLVGNGTWTSDPNWRAAVIVEGEAVTCFGMLTKHPDKDVAGLYYICTDPQQRGRGLAKDLVSTLTNHGFKLGAQEVILQASDLGKFVYDRLGFKEIGRYYFFKKTWVNIPAN